MDATGLTPEQYNLLLKIKWPSEEDEDTPVEDFLAQITTPEELHQLAWHYNWDDGVWIPDWIMQQPFCDRGTALLLFWRAAPIASYYAFAGRDEVPQAGLFAYQLDDYDLVRDIEKRYLSGFYTQQNIVYNPANDEGSDFTQYYLEIEIKQEFPAIMLEPTPGRVLERASY